MSMTPLSEHVTDAIDPSSQHCDEPRCQRAADGAAFWPALLTRASCGQLFS